MENQPLCIQSAKSEGQQSLLLCGLCALCQKMGRIVHKLRRKIPCARPDFMA
nr:MAG TPA: hypothetical protein [Caudoviricetes sp.]